MWWIRSDVCGLFSAGFVSADTLILIFMNSLSLQSLFDLNFHRILILLFPPVSVCVFMCVCFLPSLSLLLSYLCMYND